MSTEKRPEELPGGVTISKDNILLILKKNDFIDNRSIKGSDIMEIIKETDLPIKIRNSRITGGLDFTTLPGIRLEKSFLPKDWSDAEREEFVREKSQYIDEFHFVTNRIEIENTIIGSEAENPLSINAEETLFVNKVYFKKTFPQKGVSFQRATFSLYACFSDSVFLAYSNFAEAIFRNSVLFQNVIYHDKVNFSFASFNVWTSFTNTVFKKEVDFSFTTFRGVTTEFIKTDFQRDTTFFKAAFLKKVFFADSSFAGKADFSGVVFMQLAYFNNANFAKTLDFRFAVFQGYADFRKARIRQLNFNNATSPTIQTGRIDFRNAAITEAHFQELIFEKEVDFSGVEFGRVAESQANRDPDKVSLSSSSSVVFRYVTFDNTAYFLNTRFSGATVIENVNFRDEANFTGAIFQPLRSSRNFSLSYVNFSNFLIRWAQLPDPETYWIIDKEHIIRGIANEKGSEKLTNLQLKTAKERDQQRYEIEPLSQVLKRLESQFRHLGLLQDANAAYYHMKNAELTEAREGKEFWQWFPQQAHWIIWKVSCGYGTKHLWILGWSFLAYMLFAFAYLKGDLHRQSPPAFEKDFTFTLRLFEFPRRYLTNSSPDAELKERMPQLIKALRFSSVILFKIGRRDITIQGNIWGLDYKYIVWLEWLLGFFLLAALTITLSNTMPVLNKLLSGIL